MVSGLLQAGPSVAMILVFFSRYLSMTAGSFMMMVGGVKIIQPDNYYQISRKLPGCLDK
jgi:hypothetical protein